MSGCRGCGGTCCTGWGSEPCTCPPREEPLPPGPILGALLLATDGLTAGPGPDGDYLVRCPAHGDEGASLSLKEFSGGAVIRCHAGCTAEEVLGALGMSVPGMTKNTD